MVTKKKTEPLPSHEEDPILKCGEVARQIGVHRTTVWLWAKTGILEALRMPNGHVGVRQSEVNKILKVSAFFKDKQVTEATTTKSLR